MIKKNIALVALVTSLWGCSETINVYHGEDATSSNSFVDNSKKKISNNSGKVDFWDELEGETASITIVDGDTDLPISNAKVSFTNNEKFKLYTIDHPSYTHMALLRKHNSGHIFRLFKKPIILQKYDGNTNENSAAAAQALRNMWVPQGCITATDAQTNKESASEFIAYADKNAKQIMAVINTLYDIQKNIQDFLIESGLVKGGDCKAFRVYTSNTSAPVGKLLFKECLPYVPNDCGLVTVNGIVTVKGNVWQKNTSGAAYTWDEAQGYCASLTLGKKSWRMPSMDELLEIRDKNETCKMVDGLEGKCGKYWTNDDLCFGSIDNATTVVFDSSGSTSCQPKNVEHYIRCIEK